MGNMNMHAMADLTNPAGSKILIQRPWANILHNIVPLKTSILLALREVLGNSGKTMKCHGTIAMSGRVKILFNYAMDAR